MTYQVKVTTRPAKTGEPGKFRSVAELVGESLENPHRYLSVGFGDTAQEAKQKAKLRMIDAIRVEQETKIEVEELYNG